MQRLLLAVALLAVTVFATASLVKGAGYLLWPVGPFPLGNLLTVAGLVAAPLAAMLYAGERRWLRGLCWFAVALAVLWYPVSIAMAGNLNLTFYGDRGLSWYVMTGASVLLSLLSPVVVAVARLFDALRNR